MNKHKTKVIFRKYPNGEIIALFPEIYESWGCCLSYRHIEQHGGASVMITQFTKKATPEEYQSLLEELTAIGYNVEICHKFTAKMRQNLFIGMEDLKDEDNHSDYSKTVVSEDLR